MSFLWPEMLWGLLVLPMLVAAYIMILQRKKKLAVRYANLAMVREAMGASQRIRRHIPPAFFLLALAAMLLALARPQTTITLPTQHETVILAMDISGSMRATDVEPNRLVAAQNAAKQFVSEQPENVRVGVVAFAGTATVAQAPTRNREDVIAAIDRFQLQRATAIGSAIIVSLATIFPEAGIDVGAMMYGQERKADKSDKPALKPVPPGSYASAVIILLTDGQRTSGPDSVQAARLAADRGVRIYTVGFGNASGAPVQIEGYSIYMMFDEETLKAIAGLTNAEYFHASSGAELKKIYDTLTAKFVLQREETEITAFFAAAAAALVVAAAALSLAWFNRIL